MELRQKNKQAMFRILFDLKVNYLSGKKALQIKNITCFGFCLRYASAPDDVNVEEIAKKELLANPERIIENIQIIENATFEMTGRFLCTSFFHPETGDYVRSNWKIDEVITYLLDEYDLKNIA